jgi:hypothetical protein
LPHILRGRDQSKPGSIWEYDIRIPWTTSGYNINAKVIGECKVVLLDLCTGNKIRYACGSTILKTMVDLDQLWAGSLRKLALLTSEIYVLFTTLSPTLWVGHKLVQFNSGGELLWRVAQPIGSSLSPCRDWSSVLYSQIGSKVALDDSETAEDWHEWFNYGFGYFR